MDSTPDWAAIEAEKDAQRYSVLADAAARAEYSAGRLDAETNRITGAIRAAELTPEQVAQVLRTLACAMAERRYTPDAVAAVEMAAEELA